MRRGLQRQWKKSLAGIALLLVLGQTPALAATINVGGGCTLVEAILSANMNTSVGGCRAGSGADRIVLPAGSTQTLTTFNNNPYFYGRSGLPVIRSVITIAGNGSTVRRAPTAPEFGIFAVAGTGELTLQQTRVSGGVRLRSENSFGLGGGVFNNGVLHVTNSTISANTAQVDGGGVWNI